MGWRFYRRIKIAPGVTINLSKQGASFSLGERGAHITFGRNGIRRTVGIPGTGVSYSTVSKRSGGFGWPLFFMIAAAALLLLAAAWVHSS
jgi:hypothetical protein